MTFLLNFLSVFGIMLSCIALFLYLFIFAHAFFYFFYCFQEKKNNKKIEKIQKQCMFVYIGTCVPWMANETRFLKLCIFCSLDEYFHAQLSNVSFVVRCVICMIWLIFNHSYLYHSFWRKWQKKSYEKGINNHLTTKIRQS